MNRILKTLVITITIMVLSVSTCFAVQASSIKQIWDKDSIGNSAYKDGVVETYNNNINNIKAMLKSSDKIDVNESNNNIFIKAYKINSQDLISAYKKHNNIDMSIFNKYVWLTPVFDNSGKYASIVTIDKGISTDEAVKMEKNNNKDADSSSIIPEVKQNEGKWIVSSIGKDFTDQEFDSISDSSKIEQLLTKNGIKNPSEIKLILTTDYTDIFYVKDKNKEYGITFGPNPDFTGFTNGKMYSMSDIVNNLSKLSSNNIQGGPNYSNGGFNNSINNSTTSNKNIIIASIIILASISILFIVLHFVKVKKQKS